MAFELNYLLTQICRRARHLNLPIVLKQRYIKCLRQLGQKIWEGHTNASDMEKKHLLVTAVQIIDECVAILEKSHYKPVDEKSIVLSGRLRVLLLRSIDSHSTDGTLVNKTA